MLICNERSCQAHCLGGCRSVSVASSDRGGDLNVAAADHCLREIWRAIVLYGLFAVLVITGFQELPDGESILPLYIIIASAAVTATIARFWR